MKRRPEPCARGHSFKGDQSFAGRRLWCFRCAAAVAHRLLRARGRSSWCALIQERGMDVCNIFEIRGADPSLALSHCPHPQAASDPCPEGRASLSTMRGLVCTVLQAPRVAPAGSTSGPLDGHRLRHRPVLPRQCMAQLRALSAKFEGRGPAAAAAGNLFSGRAWGWVGGRRGKVGNGSTVVCRDRSGDVGSSSPLQLESGEPDALQDWPKVALSLFVIGFLLGPLLDGIHSRVGLQEYDNGAINILGLKTNVWVPPLLGLYYGVVGLLQLLLDRQFARKGQAPRADLKRVAGSFVTLAALLELSAELYKAGVPYNIEAYILFIAAEANWVLFEGTWWGFALACLVGIGAPLAEIPVEKYFGLWHYTKPDYEIFGVGAVTWVLSCYFFYTPFVSNLSRWLSAYFRQKVPKSS